MKKAVKYRLLAVSLLAAALAFTGLRALVREQRVLRVKPGMHRSEVERLLGAGIHDESHDPADTDEAPRDQYAYRANPSLWYGRLEDALVVRYRNDVVSSISRVGL